MAERSVALVTPSYGPDLERCRVLCDSVDERVGGFAHHYLLVADEDEPLFRSFAGTRRSVVRESDILPERFLVVPTPGGRRAWLSSFAWPLRGWHVQQLRRMALARHVDADALLYCDSDMAFVRPFDVGSLWRGDDLRLYRNSNGIHEQLSAPGGGHEHMEWTRHAHRLLGLEAPRFPAHDYINNLVSWRRVDVLAMLDRIETVTAKPWMRAVAAQRQYSECQIYGVWAEQVAGGQGFWIDETRLCRTFWDGDGMDAAALERFRDGMADEQVAVGIQSFTGTDPALVREVLRL